ncbi:serine hydrolase domain-containing protein [Sediminicola sp. 1XM1-17]|uniref:serine hydrolase domain-containing protein n=1 Tax=Sediminicola sp. 1XM1-17 TaxID=3127702 RepID=UPI003077E30C
MKIFKRIVLVVIVLLVVAISFNYPKLNIISGYAAKNMASSVFIAHRSPNSVNENDNNVPLIKLAKTEVDSGHKTASSAVFGFMERKAVYREGLGSVLINDTYDHNNIPLRPNREMVKNQLPFPYGNHGKKDTIFSNVDYQQLAKAVNNAFLEPDIKKTRSVLVSYKNEIIAEQYAEGFGPNTPILGWSMTKSVLATLYGILEYQGKLAVDDRVPIAAWKKDGRKNIAINHLLRMQSGLEWEEDYTRISDVTKMFFMESDMTQSQVSKKAIGKPEEIWNYSSGTSNLLSGLLQNYLEDKQAYLNFPYQSLIDKIGMHSMIIETDMANNFVGSSYAWANTRDWAKFGILYLNKGHWNGQQLFSEDWVQYITTPTSGSEGIYGAHFWLNAGGIYPDVPRDLFSANGYEGQYVFVIPSKNLVVVRTGLAEDPIFNVNEFLSEIIGAIR